jgi:hypothetical protein
MERFGKWAFGLVMTSCSSQLKNEMGWAGEKVRHQ